jgi:hypothetical protein
MIEPMARLFISQSRLDKWISEGKVTLEGDVMRVVAMARAFSLAPAVHITKIIDGRDDLQLVGCCKTSEQLVQVGAEHYGPSVIVGEIGYECTEGFIGMPVDGTLNTESSGLFRL